MPVRTRKAKQDRIDWSHPSVKQSLAMFTVSVCAFVVSVTGLVMALVK